MKRRRGVPGSFSNRRRESLMVGSVESAVDAGIGLAFRAAELRDSEHRDAGRGDDFKFDGGAFLFLRKYELDAFAVLLEREDLPIELEPLRTQFREAIIFDVKVGGQG